MPTIPAPAVPDTPQWRRWAVVLPASVLLGWGLSLLGVPAAWIVGAILASGAVALSSGRELEVNRHVFNLGRGLIGVIAALPLLNSDVRTLSHFLLPGLAVSVWTLAICLAGGLALARTRREISTETGVLSLLAGGASMMPALAKDLGADYSYVALSQYLRLLAVSVSLPLLTHLFAPPGMGEHPSLAPTEIHWWAVVLLVAIVLVAPRVATFLRIPVAQVFGPMLTTVGVGLLLPDPQVLIPPTGMQVFAFLCIGWMCGGALSVPALRRFAAQLPATITFIVVLIGGCALSAWPLTAWLGISYFEAYLATTPGALETVLALASEGNAGPSVVAIQLVRLVCILLTAGLLPKFLQRIRG
ncbi:AbrB family transcriptional regulator [Corynebacterium sp. 153RC1]|uniref:AbrB family transcriptional regulator n=1 Tax=unclassified Corynebacterium TaxID=2624378 RepID=UPI00211C9C1A|nr:AbrB family transcriptional regulator [Corynebacterium sp. 209RC1]MCQ9355220.1 AbrB family transcriptional regulator [Corynebacterium sp. 1222RC1]MCQ9357407.1 AbrB family transcriptional regulator [Corynebacterium sp. 122RC1]MCQ9359665.1 AbrB family transcriptional regulator [Corynebacterium sp. 142RC1]MCQ9361679.1 AbrB family transcriptional regulator [Corynebacterium sp. 153RC1]MCQ9363274.1 AbrB family transcriptional regulator [Corynebacterium sp. 732RC1]MCQ9365850.1 AbrB family transcr